MKFQFHCCRQDSVIPTNVLFLKWPGGTNEHNHMIIVNLKLEEANWPQTTHTKHITSREWFKNGLVTVLALEDCFNELTKQIRPILELFLTN